MIIVLDNLRSAHNVGSIIRTCDALGIKDIHFCGITPGWEDKRVQKTALGAEKNIKALECADIFSHIKELKNKNYKIVGLELDERAVDASQVPNYPRLALVVGNEISGLSEETRSQCDSLVQIPMRGVKESLNVSVAFGIAAYELTKTSRCQR